MRADERTGTKPPPPLSNTTTMRDRSQKLHSHSCFFRLTVVMTNNNKQKRDSAHPRRIDKTSEFIGIVVSLLCLSLQQLGAHPITTLFPVQLLSISNGVRQSIGVTLIAVSVIILRMVHKELARYQQPHEPGQPTTMLIGATTTTTTTRKTAGRGPFWYSRNPTYAAIVFLTQPGMALLLNNGWMIVTIPLSMILFWYILIRDEEKYLKSKFGAQWDAYCRQTRRWI